MLRTQESYFEKIVVKDSGTQKDKSIITKIETNTSMQ